MKRGFDFHHVLHQRLQPLKFGLLDVEEVSFPG